MSYTSSKCPLCGAQPDHARHLYSDVNGYRHLFCLPCYQKWNTAVSKLFADMRAK